MGFQADLCGEVFQKLCLLVEGLTGGGALFGGGSTAADRFGNPNDSLVSLFNHLRLLVGRGVYLIYQLDGFGGYRNRFA